MLVLDVCTRWNSTYSMLGYALHFRRSYDRMKSHDSNFKDPPLVEDWERARIVHGFLETFHIITNVFSGSKYCTTNTFFREIYRLVTLLRETSKDETSLLRNMASNMLIKFKKYWLERETNILLSVALSWIRDYEITCNQEVLKNEKFISNETSNSNAPFSTNIDIMADFYMHDDEEDCIHGKTELDTYLEEKLHPSKPVEQDDFNNWIKTYPRETNFEEEFDSDFADVPEILMGWTDGVDCCWQLVPYAVLVIKLVDMMLLIFLF
ncbi:hypothetical protein ACH5RR_022227 [Cinchona calisaya]|uniref:hAT-like transposase RNase-H fold domain-containing protein n=1 Tax=Cinchona calisaya TaxID=153742 RepID=A0ABD2ZAK9_9GENT